MTAPDEIPAELLGPLTRLWRLEMPLVIQMKPRDAWVVIGLMQFASRNPSLDPAQRQLLQVFGRELGRILIAIDPILEKYLEMGWNPALDVPREKEAPDANRPD